MSAILFSLVAPLCLGSILASSSGQFHPVFDPRVMMPNANFVDQARVRRLKSLGNFPGISPIKPLGEQKRSYFNSFRRRKRSANYFNSFKKRDTDLDYQLLDPVFWQQMSPSKQYFNSFKRGTNDYFNSFKRSDFSTGRDWFRPGGR